MEPEKKPYQIFTATRGITKDVIARSDGEILVHEERTLAADIGLGIAEYFGFEVKDILPNENGEFEAEQHTIQVVAMTVEEFERLQEIEWIYKDLNDEAEDNAQPEGE